jgi:hypothetical protein
MERGGILQRMRTAGLLLALFALSFKALLPPGFMLDTGGARIAITLCSGAAAIYDIKTGDIQHPGDPEPVDNSSGQHCGFALATAPALAETTAEPAPAFAYAIDAASAPLRALLGQHDATGPPLPARGPPQYA